MVEEETEVMAGAMEGAQIELSILPPNCPLIGVSLVVQFLKTRVEGDKAGSSGTR